MKRKTEKERNRESNREKTRNFKKKKGTSFINLFIMKPKQNMHCP